MLIRRFSTALLVVFVVLSSHARAQEDARLVEDVMDVSKSSWIEHASFVKEAGSPTGFLFVRINGENLTYSDVPVVVWMAFKDAESPGRFYGEQIKGRYDRFEGEPLWKRCDSRVEAPVDAMVQCAFNEDCETLLLRAIESARESIYVAAYAFTRTRIAAALVSAKARGVKVEVKMDSVQAEQAGAVRRIDYLRRNDIPVSLIVVKGEYAAMHNKFMVFDERKVLAGSYNYSTTATLSNWENMLAVDSSEIAAQYLAAWRDIASE